MTRKQGRLVRKLAEAASPLLSHNPASTRTLGDVDLLVALSLPIQIVDTLTSPSSHARLEACVLALFPRRSYQVRCKVILIHRLKFRVGNPRRLQEASIREASAVYNLRNGTHETFHIMTFQFTSSEHAIVSKFAEAHIT